MFEMAYDDALIVGREAVFVVSGDWHQKVRVTITGLEEGDGVRSFTGHSHGSSTRGIKAAKKDEPPVPVKGDFKLVEGRWQGTLVNA